MVNLMRDLQLQEHHLKLLRRTPFWLLIDALRKQRLSNDNCMKFDKVALKIIKSYDHEAKTFKIGGRGVKIQANDIALIFGIVSGEEPIPITNQYQKRNEVQLLIRRNLTETKGMTTKIVANLIESIIENDDKQAIKDVVRLVCLYLCGTLFFSGGGIQISWSFVQLMEDLPAMSNYNWSQAILDNLMKSVEACATKPKDVAGCVMLLLYWLCERTNIIEQETRLFTVPRILKWNLPKLKEKLEGIESLDNLRNVQLLDGTLQQTEREVRVFRTVRNNQTTSSDHDDSNVNDDSSEHNDSSVSPESDDEHDNESQDDDHGSNDNDNESQCGEDHRSTEKDGEYDFRNVQLLDGSLQQTNHDDHDDGSSEHDDHDDGSSEHDDSGGIPENDDHDNETHCVEDHGSSELDDSGETPENNDEDDNESQHGEDHESAEADDLISNEHRTPVYTPYFGSLVSEDGLERIDLNQTEQNILQSEEQSPIYLDSAMTTKSSLYLLSETAAIAQQSSLVYKRRVKITRTESQKEEQSSLKDQLVKSTEPEQQSCRFLDSIITPQGEQITGLFNSLSRFKAILDKKMEELQRQIDDERALKEKEMEKNEEVVKQIEDIQRTNEILLVVINYINEIAKQNDEERGARDKEKMEKSEEQTRLMLKENGVLQKENEAVTCRIGELERALKEKEMEMNKENAALQRETEVATSRIRELVEQIDKERALKEKEMEKNKELVKQMEELNCQVVKQQEQNAAKIAQLEEHKAVMNKENAALVIQIDEERALKQDTIEKLNSIIEKRDKEVKAIAYKIHTTELDELTKAQAEFNKLKREYREQILLRDGKIKMLEEQMAAPVRPEPQMAALVASEAQVNALTPQ
ncbi:hypothetical protein RHMOL_Rhmol10G0015300 [Rhododendron molle]|uniref:Uncharacterized protein n=1 Tax=Rhododendron molle TaxID=49168 RepID=A0ACC0LYS3_RHOML|nr:hypothetical protein RHMOL_Rhmol10G0015300 [Rhododendron molle]